MRTSGRVLEWWVLAKLSGQEERALQPLDDIDGWGMALFVSSCQSKMDMFKSPLTINTGSWVQPATVFPTSALGHGI